ncbi:hypothetical protein HX057_13690 [Myroides odoratimimus]|uniref:Uncharacterized protein n=2 Tax=Myroides odoratimimus TaxID=76832 RepID=A0AAI8G5U9_9FLAO|nr:MULTISPECIES: hypothetical protein [Myroides]AJA70755.1 hypothetical protein MYRA21_3669 [Myroides sp. A21]ALU27662.1 hypothetical protein AS202_16570 [Myroides odoratimimus]APA93961.1 hypothetical protein BK054_17410 [Myroides sp. ZB35]EHO07435.1 hypothetical protein HMPREF9714_02515 [Myroides odoratimimus CCUG 12901]EHO08824.1 hypothetical protein HMPREF9715_02608 [Myroides odoratimimus CIP 101113]
MNTAEFSFICFDQLNSVQKDNLVQKIKELSNLPQYLQADSGKVKYWNSIFKVFSSQQFIVLENNNLVATIHCVPLHLTKTEFAKLSDGGWRWALEKSFADHERILKPNTLCCLSIFTNKSYSENEVHQYVINNLKLYATQEEYQNIICPIRPKMKQHYPLQDIMNYSQWINNSGLPYDIEIRKHVINGAIIQGVCTTSFYVEGTILQWEKWTGYTFQSSGEYILPMGLTTLRVNVELNKGYYTEPNIWMIYKL